MEWSWLWCSDGPGNSASTILTRLVWRDGPSPASPHSSIFSPTQPSTSGQSVSLSSSEALRAFAPWPVLFAPPLSPPALHFDLTQPSGETLVPVAQFFQNCFFKTYFTYCRHHTIYILLPTLYLFDSVWFHKWFEFKLGKCKLINHNKINICHIA